MLDFLIQILNEQYNKEIVNKILLGYNSNRKVTLRVNTIKSNIDEIKNELQRFNIVYSEVEWSDQALIIENATVNQIQELEIYINGKIYLQSLSSMLPPIIMNPQKKEDILDMCAAPGGKTTQIAALTNNEAHITACEMNTIRAEKLYYNIERQGAKSIFVMQKDSRKIDDYLSFDRILLDAPCSGSGTLNFKDKKISKHFTQSLIQRSIKTQLELLKKACNIIKQGKEIIYSTCSILQCENENVVNKILQNTKVKIIPINFEGMEKLPMLPTKIPGTLCICPNEEYEGFFVAKLSKL